jgi:transposase
MGVSLSTVNRAHMAYDRGGIEGLKPKANGGRKHQNMTLTEEKALLARFAKAAGAGEMLNIHDLKVAYEKAIGHPTSGSTVYNLLHRRGWRKLMPLPRDNQGESSASIRMRKRRGRSAGVRA